jgi:hypothetical protein
VGFNEWPHYEKVALLDALKKYGHCDMENLSKAVPGKSKDQIKMTIRMWWKAARLAMQASACSDKHNKDKLKCVPKRGRGRPSGPSKSVGPSESVAEDEAPIDQWLHMHEHSQPAGGYPETRLLLKVFLYISKYENHPPPEDCNGVDYRYVGTHFFCWSYCVFDCYIYISIYFSWHCLWVCRGFGRVHIPILFHKGVFGLVVRGHVSLYC